MATLRVQGQLTVEVNLELGPDDLEGFDISSLDEEGDLRSQLGPMAYEAIEAYMSDARDSDWLSEEIDVWDWQVVE
jgi:hypothetical protein